jgi:anthranilate/para-aminobenzoate synthase component II
MIMDKKKVLIVDLTGNPLHNLEFVKPIEDVLSSRKINFKTVKITDFAQKDLKEYTHIVLSGTSLKDFEYLKYADRLAFLKEMGKPIMGICAGMQVLCSIYRCKLMKGQEIGLKDVEFDNFLGVNGIRTIYCLHNMSIKEDKAFNESFDVHARTSFIQAIKHKSKPFYGLLFHPEARNKDFIERFLYSD